MTTVWRNDVRLLESIYLSVCPYVCGCCPSLVQNKKKKKKKSDGTHRGDNFSYFFKIKLLACIDSGYLVCESLHTSPFEIDLI